jgi:hypothetical protein
MVAAGFSLRLHRRDAGATGLIATCEFCEILMWDSRPRLSIPHLVAGEGAGATF